MPPVALAAYYCTPQDVYDFVGIDAAQLRVDDRNLASGQNVTATVAVAAGATSVTVSALQYPLLAGTNLTFDGGAGVAEPVTAVLTSPANTGATSISVAALSADIAIGTYAIDNGVTTWAATLLVAACKWATVKLNQYAGPRYDYNQLAQSNIVNQWATIIASWWLGVRLYRAAPSHIESMYQETMSEIKEIVNGGLQIADVRPRTSEWPFFSNVTIDLAYTVRKVRVETQISESTPSQYPQAVDWNSYYLLEN